MRILVTGAAGFVGAHLIGQLDGHRVIATDRLDADLSLPGRTEAVVEGADPDYVVHLAARYGRLLCRDEPHRAVADNTAATTELAAVCAERGIPVLYASSSEVYGDHGTDSITEDSELRTPTTIYGLSKRWGEEALRLYLPPEDLCVVRLNMLYGPEQRGGYGCCALATFIRDALEGRPMRVHRNTSRSWLHISDAVRALCLLIEGGHHGVWNLGNSHDRRAMVQVAALVAYETDGRIELSDAPSGQIAHKNYVTSKIEALGWAPKVLLHDGIRETVDAARQNGIRDYRNEVPSAVP